MSVTACDIRYEIEDIHCATASELGRIADEVAPLVKDVTGLALPQQPVIRLLPRDAFAREITGHLLRALARDVTELGLHEGIATALHNDVVAPLLDDSVWTTCTGMALRSADGHVQVVLCPANLSAAGYTTASTYYQLLAFQLVHLAVRHAAPQVAALCDSPAGLVRGHDPRALAALTSGHAAWATDIILSRLAAAEPASPCPVPRCAPAPHWSGLPQQATHSDARGRAFIDRIRRTPGGPAALTRMWTSPHLAPRTLDELACPDRWLARTAAHH